MQFLYKKILLFLIIALSASASLWAQKDCVSATAICGTATVPPPTAGIGSITDLVSNPCSTTDNESATSWNNSTWATFTITTAGTLQMNFDANPDADIDFALWRIPGSGGIPVSLSTACASINNTGSPLASTRCDFDADATGSGFGAVCGGGAGCDPAGELTVAVGDRIVAIVSDYSTFNNFAFQAAFGGTSQHDCQPDCNSCANATCQNSAPNIYSNLAAANAGTDGCNPEQVRSNQNGANATFCTTFTTPSGLSGQYISMAGSLTSTVISGSPCAAFVSESLQDAACGTNITPTFTTGGYPAWQVASSTTYKYCWVWGGGGNTSCDQYSSPCFRPFYNCPTITVSGATTVCGTTTYTQTGAVSPLGTWSVSPIAAGTITSGGVFTPTVGFTGAATITYTEPSPSVCAGSLAITVATGPTTTGATICPGGSGTLSSSTCSNATGSTTGSVTLNGTSTTSAPVTGSFTPTVPAGATVTSISYTSSTASTTDWRSELRFEIIHTSTMSIQPDNVNNTAGSVTAPAASSNTFNGLAAAGAWTVQWRDVTSPYQVTVSNQTITVTINYTFTPTHWYTTASGGTPVQTGTPFNPINDAEVIAAGAPYSSLTNTNTPGTYTFYAACSSTPNCRTATNFVINTPPTANAGSDVTLTCTTPSATIGTTAVAGNTYAWSPATGLSATNVAQPTANGASTQTYTVTVTGSNGCTATDAVVVTADKTAPTANAGSDVTLTCTTPSATIGTAAVAGNTYAWSPATGLSATNVAQPTANGTSTQTYTVTVTGSNGCTATDAVVVTADKAAPTANAGSDVTLTCTTPSATIGTAAVAGNTYAWSPATGLSATNVAQPTANGTSTQTYTVTVTGSNGCTATDAVVVTVDKAAPTANAGSDVTLTCTTPSATIGTAAVAGNTYAWSPATGLSATNVAQPTANGTSTQTYTVTVTGSNGCTATDAVVVTVDKAAPTTTITGTTTYCLNDAATALSASGTGTFAWTGSGVNGPASGSGSTLTPQTTNAGNTNYTVTLTAANGCQDTDMATVTVNNCACPTPPSVLITPATAATCGTNVVTLNYTVANGPAALSHDGSGTLSTTSLANGTGTFTYTPSAGDAGNTVTVTATIADPDGAGVCVASTDNVVITVNALPAATAASNSPVACGGTINLTSSGGNAYSWAGPGGFTSSAQNPTRTGANASMAGTYTVTVTGSNGCTASASTVVSVSGCSFVFGILDPCACRNNATTLTNGQFNETVIVTGPAGFVVRAEVVTGLYQPASTAVTLVPFTVPVNMPYNGTNGYELQGAHVDNTGYTVTAGIYQSDGVTPVDIDPGTPGVQNTLTISNKCAYPNPDFALPSTVCNTGAAITLTATNGAGPAGTGTFSGPGVSSSTFYPASAGVGGPYNITLQYTGGADANSGVSPDGGTTPAYPGCVQDVAKSISVTDCCGASVGTFPGN